MPSQFYDLAKPEKVFNKGTFPHHPFPFKAMGREIKMGRMRMTRVSSCCPLLQAIDAGERVVVGRVVEHVAHTR